MERTYSFAPTPDSSIENVLLSNLNMDYRNDFDELKKVVSEPFEGGRYEIELFRPKSTKDDSGSNSALSRNGLLKRFPANNGWRFGTLEHLATLMKTDRSGLINEAAGIPVVVAGSYGNSFQCPILHTYAFDANGFLLDLESSWFFETMPYFLRLRKV